MYNNPYFIPNFYPRISPTMIPRTPYIPRNINLFQKLGNSIKTINWTNLVNNTSKTLGIINQSIPIVKQVGPVMNNMKSILRIASILKDEPNIKKSSPTKTNYSSPIPPTNNTSKENDTYSPTFFIT